MKGNHTHATKEKGSTETKLGDTPRVSNHAQQRYMKRSGDATVYATEIEVEWAEGIRVEIDKDGYSEARLVRHQGVWLVLLRKGDTITTVLRAGMEEVSFHHEKPDLACSCGFVRHEADDMRPCGACGNEDWSLGDEVRTEENTKLLSVGP